MEKKINHGFFLLGIIEIDDYVRENRISGNIN
jgi:hypothetical protein